MYTKDLNEPKFQFWVKIYENPGAKHLNNLKAFIEHSNTIDDIYNNIDYYNPTRKRKILIVFNDMIADIMTHKKSSATIKELFITCGKLNMYLVYYHAVLFFCSKII